jgi:hypothetical protein
MAANRSIHPWLSSKTHEEDLKMLKYMGKFLAVAITLFIIGIIGLTYILTNI